MSRMNTPIKNATRTAVSVTGMRKAYGEKVVLDDVDLSIGEGEVFGLLGPNGAGKTTMVRILSTLIQPDAGTASVFWARAAHRARRYPLAHRGHRAVLCRRQLADWPGEPIPHRPPAASGADRTAGEGRPAAGALRPRRGGAPHPSHLFRRHETPPGHRDDPDGTATADLSRRANHRLGPAQPPHDVADHSRSRRRWRQHPADHAVLGGG